MTNILTASEAANVLRCATDDAKLVQLLPQVDAYIQQATGRAWQNDSSIHAMAKAAAEMLLTLWYENPGMAASGMTTLDHGLTAALTQLEAYACRYKTFAGRDGAGGIDLVGAHVGDTVSTLVGVVGVSGDQSAEFEAVITVEGEIQQVSVDDLSENWYRAYMLAPGEL